MVLNESVDKILFSIFREILEIYLGRFLLLLELADVDKLSAAK